MLKQGLFDAGIFLRCGTLKKVIPLLVHSNSLSSEAALLELFDHQSSPKYDNVFLPDVKNLKEENVKEHKREKKGDVIINCKRTQLNHYMNQQYNKFKPVPLACKGWHRNKSKGDFFSIKMCNKNLEPNSLHLDEEKSFDDLKLDFNIIDSLRVQNILKPTKIQALSIPVLLSGKNSLIAAETGCGKTYAYLLPIVQHLLFWTKFKSDRLPNSPLALILAPQRELTEQIGHVAKLMSHCLPFKCDSLVGGRTKRKMLHSKVEYVDLLVATPGALSKMVSTGIYSLEEVSHVVIDEADSMLDDSFQDLLLRILRKLQTHKCQFTFVSATMPKNVYANLEDIIEANSLTVVQSKKLHQVLTHVMQTFYRLGKSEKPAKLLQLVKQSIKQKQPTLIFSSKASTCDWISLMLNENGIGALNLNGQMNHALRHGRFNDFQDGKVLVLSCTDIASRGLDTVNVKHIINYDFPTYMADYIHRCGRTGRIGSPSDAIVSNFITRRNEIELLKQIEMAIRIQGELPDVNGNITKLKNRDYQRNKKKEFT